MKPEETLSYKLSHGIALTDEQINSFFALVSKHCREDTKRFLLSMIKYGLRKNYGIFSRVYFVGNECRYCAGQSYPDEIREIRKLLLKGN